MFRQDVASRVVTGLTVREVLAFPGFVGRVHGGPMTVVAGVVALLLLGYLVVALLKPERF